ncbi:MAG: glycosyltransferase family 4 protein, partial [Chlorobi bacterium]|nr:glycosyltransferase family 4 protein [Chlorobiota bacterium]
MRILMFNNEFPPLGGGTGTVNLELFNVFKNIPNLEIDLITSSFSSKKEVQKYSDNISIIKLPVGKKEIHHASNIELIMYALKATRSAFKYHKQNKYDFVFVWTTVPSGLPAIFLNLFKKLPFVLRIGGSDIPGFEERYSLVYKFITPFIKFVWKKAKRIIVKCNTEKEMVTTINPNLKIDIINNGIDTNIFFPLKNHQT